MVDQVLRLIGLIDERDKRVAATRVNAGPPAHAPGVGTPHGQRRPRAIVPASSGGAPLPPRVTALSGGGSGGAPPVVIGSGRPTVPAPTSPPEPALNAAFHRLGGALHGIIGNPADNLAPARAISAGLDASANRSGAETLSAALAYPQARIGDAQGEILYHIATADPGQVKPFADALVTLMNLTTPQAPGTRDNAGSVAGGAIRWAMSNRDEVVTAYEKGGPGAVWGDFVAENLTYNPSQKPWEGDNVAALVSGAATDPLNWGVAGAPLAAAGKARAGAEGASAVARALGRAQQGIGLGLAAPDLVGNAVTDAALGTGRTLLRPVGNQLRKTRIGGAVGRAFETDPRQQARNLTDAVMRAIKQEDDAGIVSVTDPDGVTPGAPPPPLPAAPTPPAPTTPGGHPMGPEEAVGNDRAGAVNRTRRTLGAPGGPQVQLERKRVGRVDRYYVRPLDDLGEPGRGKGFDTLAGALREADAMLPPITAAPSPPTGPYRREPRRIAGSQHSRNAFDARMREAAGDHPELVEAVMADQEVAEQFATYAEARAKPFEYWATEFEAERDLRERVLDAGGQPGPHVNNHYASSASPSQYLDTIAWSTDDAERDAAREALEVWKGRDSRTKQDIALMDQAMNLAENNPLRGTGGVPEAAPAAPMPASTAPMLRQTPGTDLPDDIRHMEALLPEDRDVIMEAIAQGGAHALDLEVADDQMRAAHDLWLRSSNRAASDPELYGPRAASDRARYEQAAGRARDVLETFKRSDDYTRQNAATPEITQAILGPHQDLIDTAEAVDRSFALNQPVVPDATRDLLDQVFSERNLSNVGRTFGEVARASRHQVRDELEELRLLLIQPGKDPKAMRRLEALMKKYPRVRLAGDVDRLSPERLWRQQLNQEFREHLGAKDPTAIGQGLDWLSHTFSALTLTMPWSVAKYMIGNLAGDTAQTFVKYGPEATAAMNDPRITRVMGEYALHGADPLRGAVGNLYTELGLGGYHYKTLGENVSEAMLSRMNARLNRAGGKSRPSWVGKLPNVAENPWTKTMRNVNNGLEWGRRTGLHAHMLQKNVIAAREDYIREMADLSRRHGVDERTLRQTVEALGPRFSGSKAAEAFGNLAIGRGASAEDAAGFAEQMGRRWANKVYAADEQALRQMEGSLFSYEPSQIDTWVRRVVPFHMWATRALPFYAEQGMRHPGLAHAWLSLNQQTQAQAEREGWPDSLKTYAKFWEGPGGVILFFNPAAALGLMDMPGEGYTGPEGESKTVAQEILDRGQQWGFGLLPIWHSLLSNAGLLGDDFISDPIGLYSTENTIRIMAQQAAAAGWLGEDRRGYLGRPYDQMWQNIRSITSGLTSGIGIGEHIQAADASAGDLHKIKTRMLENELAERGINPTQFEIMRVNAQIDPGSPDAQAVNELLQSVLDDYTDGNSAWLTALEEVSRGEAEATWIKSVLPGPKSTRQRMDMALQGAAQAATAISQGEVATFPGMDMPANADTAWQNTVADPRDVRFLSLWRHRFGQSYRPGDLEAMLKASWDMQSWSNATPEAGTLMNQQASYEGLGSQEGRDLLRQYYAIANAEAPLDLPDQDLHMTPEQLQGYDASTRYDLADAWLARHDPDGEVAFIKEARGMYAESHPELGAYLAWRGDTRKQWGTPAAFRDAAIRANPNYAAFIARETSRLRAQGKTPSEIDAQLNDFITFSPESYFAYQGRVFNRYDPEPLATGAPLPVASEGAPEESFGGGGGSGGGTGGSSWGERVRSAIADAHAARKRQYALLGTTLDRMPPEFAAAYRQQLPDDALPPADYWIFEQYADFYAQATAAGEDPSIEAFIAATTQQQGEQDQASAINLALMDQAMATP